MKVVALKNNVYVLQTSFHWLTFWQVLSLEFHMNAYSCRESWEDIFALKTVINFINIPPQLVVGDSSSFLSLPKSFFVGFVHSDTNCLQLLN